MRLFNTHVMPLLCGLLVVINIWQANHSDIEEKLDRALQLKSDFNDEQALLEFKFVLSLREDHYKALWSTVILHTFIGYRQERDVDKMKHYNQACKYADRLLELYPDSADAHFAVATAKGRKSQISGTRERVRLSGIIRHHAEKAVELDPDHAFAWHLLGLWHYYVADLSRLERIVARRILGAPFDDTGNEMARKALQRAIEIDPEYIVFHYDMARFFLRTGAKEKAREAIETGLELPKITSLDAIWLEYMREMHEDI